MKQQFTNKVIIITGSTQGSGAETARLFASRGARAITICGRQEDKALEVKKDIESYGTECLFVKADLANVEDCKKCSLHKIRDNIVFGDGDSSADLMIIGEAPGREEDKAGKPFIGRAGKLLNSFLSSINLDRESIFITFSFTDSPLSYLITKKEQRILFST